MIAWWLAFSMQHHGDGSFSAVGFFGGIALSLVVFGVVYLIDKSIDKRRK